MPAIIAVISTVFAACDHSVGTDAKDAPNTETETKDEDRYDKEYCMVMTSEQDKKDFAEFKKQKAKAEKWERRAEDLNEVFNLLVNRSFAKYKDLDPSKLSTEEQTKIQEEMQTAQETLVKTYGKEFIEKATKIHDGFNKECPLVNSQQILQMDQMKLQIESMLKSYGETVPEPTETDNEAAGSRPSILSAPAK